ncbi:sialin-like isoform X2 [Parasteatoda tepidariorum]|uniref:sialin-like isoform X2 n=1 Tax=Parasteatoda tepidariorum TaxID=114398 RepID=UPI00077F94AE|nr:sialin-like isoform X2 [Parasteatoda tepidariorum]
MVNVDKLQLEPQQKCYFPARFVLSFLLFWAMVLEYAHRVCLSVTIVAMVNQSAFDLPNSTLDTDDTCGLPDNVNATSPEEQGDYIWSPSIQGVILGAYFYGYVCTQAVGGRLSEMAGGKWPLGLSILLASLLTLVTPVAADIGVLAIIFLRLVMGLVHGICLPTAFAMFALWAPLEERSTLISLCVMGDHVGTILSMPLAGYLCENGFSGGWPSVYYILGILGCVWFIFWTCLAYSTPSDHPRISKRELEYIGRGNIQMNIDQKLPIPWQDIMSSLPVWTLTFCIFTSSWGFTTLLTKLPTYLEVVLHIPIQKNGLVNSLIYVCACITLFITGYASDYLRTKKHYSATKVRKSFQLFGMMGPAMCMALIPLMGCNKGMVILLLTAAMGFQGFAGGGYMSITADMAPHHSATLFGIVNGIGCTAGIFSPMVAGLLLEEAHSSIHQWGIVFYISSGLYVVGGIAFLLFASAERQPWAYVPVTDDFSNTKYIKIKQDLENSSKYGTLS